MRPAFLQCLHLVLAAFSSPLVFVGRRGVRLRRVGGGEREGDLDGNRKGERNGER